MAKTIAKVCKSYKDGHVKVRMDASAHNWFGGNSVSASISVDIDLETARALQTELGAAIEKEAAKMESKRTAEERRKKWRDREVAAGRRKIISFNRM
jgi:hypothetical protein